MIGAPNAWTCTPPRHSSSSAQLLYFGCPEVKSGKAYNILGKSSPSTLYIGLPKKSETEAEQITPQTMLLLLAFLFISGLACPANAYSFLAQEFLTADPPSPAAAGLCQQPFTPTPQHPVPGRKPLFINETINFHERHVNGSHGGEYRRSSCPAVNTLANRGFINRSGRDITADELIQAFVEVFNFGIDNV